MGCSKGRGLFHKPRASFLRCWVICKATPGRRCAAPRRLRSLNWDFDCKEGHAPGRRDFSLRAGHREVPTVPLPKPEAVGKALHLLIAHLAALSAAALSSECHGSAGAGQQPPATSATHSTALWPPLEPGPAIMISYLQHPFPPSVQKLPEHHFGALILSAPGEVFSHRAVFCHPFSCCLVPSLH